MRFASLEGYAHAPGFIPAAGVATKGPDRRPCRGIVGFDARDLKEAKVLRDELHA